MNNVVKKMIAIVVAATLFTGCGTEDLIKEASGIDTSGNSGSGAGSSGNDALTVSKTGEGFLVTWTKNSSGYSEVIYTDGTRGARGNGYPLTSNSTGTFFLNCTEGSRSVESVAYTCQASNITGMTTSVNLAVDTPYEWLVSYGTEHEHGETEAIMEYTSGTLTIE